jgi:hypothetical protein
MSSDLSITAASSPGVGNEVVAAARPPVAAPPPATSAASGASGTSGAPTPAAQVAAASSTANPTPNPTLELDAALGLVVIQFHNDSGAVTSSIPSQQQINAYRLWQETRIGPAPSLGGGVVPLAGVVSKA